MQGDLNRASHARMATAQMVGWNTKAQNCSKDLIVYSMTVGLQARLWGHLQGERGRWGGSVYPYLFYEAKVCASDTSSKFKVSEAQILD